jgi:hypothetical protein
LKKLVINWDWGLMPVIPATQEAETVWVAQQDPVFKNKQTTKKRNTEKS